MIKQGEIFLSEMFEKWAGEDVRNIVYLPPSGSYREYFRISGKNKTALGVYNPDKKENIAFLNFAVHFRDMGLNVPEIYGNDDPNNLYLIEDLGDKTLFSILTETRKTELFSDNLTVLYKKVISTLPGFQITAGKTLDYSYCYPRYSFDKQSMLWDLSYFKYYFLKLAKIHFDEQLLEDDFHTFTDFLLKTETDYFLYRDFQSRNIMFKENEPYFIDFQGGRKGALQYDIASLLFDAKADIPQETRDELLEFYLDKLEEVIKIDREEFKKYYYGYVVIRILQAMGAYGFRGFYEKKEHFLKSIPFALNNLRFILSKYEFPVKIPTLTDVLKKLTESDEIASLGTEKKIKKELKISINSFSYKRGIPIDKTGNGGGYVFDCRCLVNPGQFEEFKNLTGKDKLVKDFIEKENNINLFLENIYSLVDQSLRKYQERDFTDLMVSFGCTGGQHRSVYCAEELAAHLKEMNNVIISLHHLEQENKTKYI